MKNWNQTQRVTMGFWAQSKEKGWASPLSKLWLSQMLFHNPPFPAVVLNILSRICVCSIVFLHDSLNPSPSTPAPNLPFTGQVFQQEIEPTCLKPFLSVSKVLWDGI